MIKLSEPLVDIKSVPINVVSDWIQTLLVVDENNNTNIAELMQMTDAEKITNIVSYLTTRISDNTAQISTLAASITIQEDALTADTTVCSTLLDSFSE